MTDALERIQDYLQAGRLDAAETALDAYLRTHPKDADGLVLRGLVLAVRGQADEAANALRKANNAAPNRWDIQHNAGLAYLHLNRTEDALKRFNAAIRLDPGAWTTTIELGHIQLDRLHRPAAAAEFFRQALAAAPAELEAQYHLGKALFQLGECDAAIELWRTCRSVAESVGRTDIAALCRQSIATTIPGAMSADNATILSERQAWTCALNLTSVSGPSFADRNRHPDRPLVIGYISSFFDSENWMKPVWGLINHQERERYPVRIFSFGPVPGCDGDSPPTAFRPHESDRIFDVERLEHERVASLIADEQVDVLVDLNGYSDPRRLEVIAMRPAPVIVGWFNMYATTALACFDYLIGDRHVVLPEEEVHYTERIARVPGSYLTFDVGYPVPEVAPSPAARNGYITFGSLCSRYKFTPEVLDAWSEILNRCPAARLLLRNGGLESSSECEHLLQQFASRGVDLSRIELLGRAAHYEFLETYGRIDIALDTFPYNGGTTTTEAIWQGVPVVAYAGRTWASRTSATLLREGGLGDWVADDLTNYIELAVRWGNDVDSPRTLKSLRARMRETLAATSVCDTVGFARAMEALYRRFWRAWSVGPQ